MGLKSARMKAGLKVYEVMHSLNVSDAAVYQWEKGRTHPSFEHLKQLAELYGCTVDELLKEDRNNDT